jgi:late competence protein required for DNA uptake (superfamily II DNA/RNA helicase)
MAKTQHIHKLRRFKYKSGNIKLFCQLPDCNFKQTPALLIGKRSLCNRCGNEFILNEYSVRLAKPHCNDCHKSNNVKKTRADLEFESTVENRKSEPITDRVMNVPLSLSERLAQTLKRNNEVNEIDDSEEI